MSVRVRVAVVMLAATIGCGGGGESSPDAAVADARPPDASPPDAIPCDGTVCGSECVDTTTDHSHCGTCLHECTPTQDCEASNCECPEFVAPTGTFAQIMTQMDDTLMAPAVLGIGVYTPDDSIAHALVIGFHPIETPLDADLDLSASGVDEPPFVGFGYDLDVTTQTYRGSFRSVSGTLHLTTRCAAGVAGSMSNVVLQEVDIEGTPPMPLEDGCSFEITSLDFDYFSQHCD